MSHFWPDALPIEVDGDETAAPARITWRCRSLRIARVLERWRIDEAWWQRRIWREYFVVYTEDGLILAVYRDLSTRRWWLQRIYD